MHIPPSAGKPLATAPLGMVFPKGPFRILVLNSAQGGWRMVQFRGVPLKVPDHPDFRENQETLVRYQPDQKILVPVGVEQRGLKELKRVEVQEKDWPFPEEPSTSTESGLPDFLSIILQNKDGRPEGQQKDSQHPTEEDETETQEIQVLLETSVYNARSPQNGYRWIKLPVLASSPVLSTGWAYFLWNIAERRVESALLSVGHSEQNKRWRFLRAENGRWYGYIVKGGEGGGERVDIVL